MRIIRMNAPGVRLLIAGTGPLRSSLEDEIGAAGLATNVSILGLRKDVRALMQAADAFVMSSAWEGMPVVLLEAAAAGLPIVATRVGGNPEVVCDGESGFLVPPRDSDALGLAMLRLTGLSEAQRRSMGERGREHVRAHYGLNRVVERWEDIYRGVLERKGIAFAPTPSPTLSS